MISVIIPVYNSEKYLERCIKSLIQQTLKNIEFIFINDGSTDSSIDIINKYKLKDNRIRLISQKNQGVSIARNIALKHCKGEYIGFIDSDDFIRNNMYELMYKKITCDKSDMVIAGYEKHIIIGNTEEVRKYSLINNDIKCYEDVTKYIFEYFSRKHDNGYLWNKLYKKSIINKYNIRFDSELTMCEDLLFNVQYMYYVEKISNINESLYYYIIRSDSQTYKIHKNGFKARKLIYKQSIKNAIKWNISYLKLSEVYSKYPYIYAKEQLILKNMTLRKKIERINEIIRDEFTLDIKRLINNNNIVTTKGCELFYKLLNNKILIYLYLFLTYTLSKYKLNNDNKY